jgi:hypothetical protein
MPKSKGKPFKLAIDGDGALCVRVAQSGIPIRAIRMDAGPIRRLPGKRDLYVPLDWVITRHLCQLAYDNAAERRARHVLITALRALKSRKRMPIGA